MTACNSGIIPFGHLSEKKILSYPGVEGGQAFKVEVKNLKFGGFPSKIRKIHFFFATLSLLKTLRGTCTFCFQYQRKKQTYTYLLYSTKLPKL